MTDDDVDARFAEIIAGWEPESDASDTTGADTSSGSATDPPAEPRRTFRPQESSEHELSAPLPVPPAPDPLDPAPDEPYVPEPLPPARLSGAAWAGALLVGYALVMLLTVVLGVHYPRLVGWSVVVAFVAGVLILFSRLPRRRDPWDGDGAQV